MLKQISSYFLAALLLLSITGCVCTDGRQKPQKPVEEEKNSNDQVALLSGNELSAKPDAITQAVAEVRGTKDAKITGKITFTKVPEGIKIIGDVDGLTPGKHGFHVHEHGDCSGADGMKAGAHFNPTHTKHGGPDSAERHVGDLGNLEADATGHAHYERVDKIITLAGENSIVNRSIIIHADPDDFVTQPTGASGARIACGIITAVAISK